MAEYIEREALIAEIQKNIHTYWSEGSGGYYLAEDALNYSVKTAPTADVVPKSEEGAECPTCHGTGRIGTTDWLTKGLSKKQLAEEKAKAIAEHEQHIKTEVAREIFEDFTKHKVCTNEQDFRVLAQLKKKYTENENG